MDAYLIAIKNERILKILLENIQNRKTLVFVA